jgi:amino-acid N-acetyltransferase
MSAAITIRQAMAADLAAAQSWLSGSGLPIGDLTPQHMQNFLVAVTDATPVGMIGLEQFGNIGLLRSLVVDSSVRRGGIGARLVAALESMASGLGVTELWLLTIDADAYFSRFGYVVTDRSDVPEAIRGTEEFSNLCPRDAALMKKGL